MTKKNRSRVAEMVWHQPRPTKTNTDPKPRNEGNSAWRELAKQKREKDNAGLNA